MQRLYARIVVGMAMAVAAGWLAVALFIPQLQSLLEDGLKERVLGSGVQWIANRFDESPETEWPQQLATASRELSMPLRIVPAEVLPANARANESLQEAVLVRPEGAPPSVYVPLHDGSHFLVAGPIEPPPVTPLVITALVFTVVITITASAVVGIPLVRRLRSVRHAIRELGSGNWAVRLDPKAEGALSDLAESINRTATQLQHQFQEREALIQAVSHEMGTPLSRMRFQIELLDPQTVIPEQRQRLQALSEDLDELDELSTELASWIESGSSTSAKRVFNVREALDSLIELERLQSDGALQLTLTSPSEVPLHADRRQFERAIENLVRNAVRYAHAQIVVEVTGGPTLVVVEVRDDGPGIPPEQWTRVLEPFVRIEGARSRAHRGLGLGLAIVRRIVEAHGGSVSVTDAPEGGTRVRTTWSN